MPSEQALFRGFIFFCLPRYWKFGRQNKKKSVENIEIVKSREEQIPKCTDQDCDQTRRFRLPGNWDFILTLTQLVCLIFSIAQLMRRYFVTCELKQHFLISLSVCIFFHYLDIHYFTVLLLMRRALTVHQQVMESWFMEPSTTILALQVRCTNHTILCLIASWQVIAFERAVVLKLICLQLSFL